MKGQIAARWRCPGQAELQTGCCLRTHKPRGDSSGKLLRGTALSYVLCASSINKALQLRTDAPKHFHKHLPLCITRLGATCAKSKGLNRHAQRTPAAEQAGGTATTACRRAGGTATAA